VFKSHLEFYAERHFTLGDVDLKRPSVQSGNVLLFQLASFLNLREGIETFKVHLLAFWKSGLTLTLGTELAPFTHRILVYELLQKREPLFCTFDDHPVVWSLWFGGLVFVLRFALDLRFAVSLLPYVRQLVSNQPLSFASTG